MANETAILPLFPLRAGEKLLILANRLKNLTGLSATDLSTKTGYSRTYIPKLYDLEHFNQKQLNIVAAALNVPPDVFTNGIDIRIAALELDVEALKNKNAELENRVRVLEAENNGLRLALNN